MNKILTIIIPTYNMEKYLRHCLDSLIIDEEGMKRLEVLIVNDGSKDSSSQIAHEYQDKYPDTFRVIDKENGNYGSCINRGLKEAMGKYVKVLDADDSYNNDIFARYIYEISKTDVDLILNDVATVNSNDTIFKKSVFDLTPNHLYCFEALSMSVYKRIYMHAIAYRTSIFKGIKYLQTEGISYTDQQWIFMPMVNVKSVLYINGCLYRYLIGREGQTVGYEAVKRQLEHKVLVANSMLEFYESQQSLSPCISRYLLTKVEFCYNELYRICLKSDDKKMLQKVIEIDDFIKIKSKTIYELLQNSTMSPLFPYHFIRCWRKDKQKAIPSIYFLIGKYSSKANTLLNLIVNLFR